VNTETQKRLDIAGKISEELRNLSKGIIIVGSVAHSPSKVSVKSDLDLIIIVEDLYAVIDKLGQDINAKKALQNRFFDGYCIKEIREGVPVSMHFLSDDALDIISKCNVADIRVYRPNTKEGVYKLFGFESQEYDYFIKNIQLKELDGSRTIVPVAFIKDDRYYIGIHRDKLLSKPTILYDSDGSISIRLDKLWINVVKNLITESNRLDGKVDLTKMNILNALSKRQGMSRETQKWIELQTKLYIGKLI